MIAVYEYKKIYIHFASQFECPFIFKETEVNHLFLDVTFYPANSTFLELTSIGSYDDD